MDRWITLTQIKYMDQEGKEVRLPVCEFDSYSLSTRRDHGNAHSEKLANRPESTVYLWALSHHARELKRTLTGVAVLAILRSKTNAFRPSTILIEQYRPPIGKYIIGI
jgi:hypothetical protein